MKVIMACMEVQAVVKANSQSNGKGQFSTPCGPKTPQQISMKLRKSQKLQYVSNGLTDLHEIWQGDAKWVLYPPGLLKIELI